MQTYMLNLQSYTAAMKASSVLSKNKIKSSIEKNADPANGCVYTLKIFSDYDTAVALLQKNNIGFTSAHESVV